MQIETCSCQGWQTTESDDDTVRFNQQKNTHIVSFQRLYKEAVLERNGLYFFNGSVPAWIMPKVKERGAVAMFNRYVDDPASFYASKTNMVADHSHMMYVKGTRIGAAVDAHVAQMKAMGMMAKWLRSAKGIAERKHAVVNESSVQLTLHHLIPAMLILVGGGLSSILAFVAEHSHFHFSYNGAIAIVTSSFRGMVGIARMMRCTVEH
jgi:hypothetical protein